MHRFLTMIYCLSVTKANLKEGVNSYVLYFLRHPEFFNPQKHRIERKYGISGIILQSVFVF